MLKAKLDEIENERKVLDDIQTDYLQLFKSINSQEEIDSRSVWVGNVDFSTKPEELKEHFLACGQIHRITIVVDKWTGKPKGFAYIEFVEKEAVDSGVELNDSIFKGRPLKVVAKRTNKPGFSKRKPGRRRRSRARRFSYFS